MDNEKHNSGWEEASKYYLETHIPVKKVAVSFDKFFDKIKNLKGILFSVHSHFRKNIDIDGESMLESSHKIQNLDLILNMIDNLIQQDKRGVKNGQKSDSREEESGLE